MTNLTHIGEHLLEIRQNFGFNRIKMVNTEGSRVISQTLRVRKNIAYSLTDRQTQILIGSLLGDAYIHPLGKICFEQSSIQQEYLNWKYTEFKNLAYPKIAHVSRLDKRSQNQTFSCRFFLKQIFRTWRNIWYLNGHKILPTDIEKWFTPLTLAVWYMDDGHLEKGVAPLFACESFTQEESSALASIMSKKWQLKCYVNNNNRIRISRESSRHFIEIVDPYIVPSMRYKITLTP